MPTFSPLANQIIEYVKNEAKRGRYPTYYEIEKKFRTNVKTHFKGIREVYKLANVAYVRDPNPFVKLKKEETLTKICVRLLKRLGYSIERVSIEINGHGPDLIVRDGDGNSIPIEIKAYQKYGKIGSSTEGPTKYFADEFEQIRAYIKELKSPFGILITSTDRSNVKSLPHNIKLLYGKDIANLLQKFHLKKELKQLEWIKYSNVSTKKERYIEAFRKKILIFVRRNLIEGKYVSKREIEKRFGINYKTYFQSMKEIYQNFNVDTSRFSRARMGGNIDKKVMRKRILDFCRKKIKKGHYPTYKEIQRTFRCLPKLFFPGGIREIFKQLKIEYNRKFARKTPEEKEKIKRKVINFVRKNYKRGIRTTWRDIRKELDIGVYNYFRSMKDVYEQAGITNHRGQSG
jgi:hypothetical protein